MKKRTRKPKIQESDVGGATDSSAAKVAWGKLQTLQLTVGNSAASVFDKVGLRVPLSGGAHQLIRQIAA
jgi:hypothetical protein